MAARTGANVNPRRGRFFPGLRVAVILSLGLILSLGVACGDPGYLELQIADAELPFLLAGTDFDALEVTITSEGCPQVDSRFAAAPLPATLTIRSGECYAADVQIAATAGLGGRVVAASPAIATRFPDSGPLVVTATLADVAGRRVLFETGFDEDRPLDVVIAQGVTGFTAETSSDAPLTAPRSALISGTATTAGFAFARLAATNIVIARGDELVFTLEIDGLSTVGLELELSTGATAASLMLADRQGRQIDPTSAKTPARSQWAVDLTPAAGARLVGILAGFDGRGTAGIGPFSARIDDLAVAQARVVAKILEGETLGIRTLPRTLPRGRRHTHSPTLVRPGEASDSATTRCLSSIQR